VKGQGCFGLDIFHDATLNIVCLGVHAFVKDFVDYFLLEDLPELLQPLLFFPKLGMHLTELLEVDHVTL
jgi:hypothetical protein